MGTFHSLAGALLVAMTISSFLVIVVTCLARSTGKQSSDFVWTSFINNTGWGSNGIVFLTGLVSPNYIYGGIDGAIHLAEECSNATVAIPRALMATTLVGFVTAFAFTVAMAYSMNDFTAVLNSPTG
jgi:choline transport protein